MVLNSIKVETLEQRKFMTTEYRYKFDEHVKKRTLGYQSDDQV